MPRYSVSAGPKVVSKNRTLEEQLAGALACHRAGKLAEAEKHYTKVLQADGNSAQAMTLLGTLYAQQGNFDAAIKLLNRTLEIDARQPFALNSLGNALNALGRHDDALAAFDGSIALNPGQAATYSNSGTALRALKRHREALASYRKAIAIDPNYAEAYSNQGDVLQELKKYDVAVISYDKAIALRPDSARDWFGRAVALQEAGRDEEAFESYNVTIALKSDFAEAWNNRGNALASLRRYVDAQESYTNAVKLNPNYAEAYNNWGNVLRRLRLFEEALVCYDQAIARKPDYAEAYTNLGLALQNLGRHEDALQSYDSAIRIRPNDAQAHNNRGNAWRGIRNYEEALASYDRAIACEPHYAAAHYNRGLVLKDLGRTAAALSSYDTAIGHNPTDAGTYYAKAIALRHLKRFDEALSSIDKVIELDAEFPYALGERLNIKLHMCDWNGLPATYAAVTNAIKCGLRASIPFPIIAIPATPTLQRQCAESYVKDKYPPRATPIGSMVDADVSESHRIRVAYLSADFHSHATAYLIAGVLEQHDRSRFKIYVVSFGKSDNSAMRSRLERACQNFVDASGWGDRDVARFLRSQNVDIAVDLKGFTKDARPGIFAFHSASIQVNYLGYPGTMGASYMDYLIADKVLIAEEEQYAYSEKVVYLPDTYQCNDSTRIIGEPVPSRSEVGLPEQGFVFCSFNNNYKITPEIFDIWTRLLLGTENSVLWLLESNPAAARNLRQEAKARGVAGERLVFAPWCASQSDHLSRIRLADLFLDTLPCGAHTTASDALWAGVPVLTCRGTTFAGRVAASLLTAIGLPDMVTYTLEEYEARALAFAHDPSALAEMKTKLAENRRSQPLFDTIRFTRHLEAAFASMWQRHQGGNPPAAFTVELIA